MIQFYNRHRRHPADFHFNCVESSSFSDRIKVLDQKCGFSQLKISKVKEILEFLWHF